MASVPSSAFKSIYRSNQLPPEFVIRGQPCRLRLDGSACGDGASLPCFSSRA